MLDSAVLDDLSDEHLAALRRFVDKRGGGMLILGDALKAREKLGGVAPVRQAEAFNSKDNRRVVVIEEPVFAPEDEVENMKVFLPSRLPSLVARSSNPAARAGVITRSGAFFCLPATTTASSSSWIRRISFSFYPSSQWPIGKQQVSQYPSLSTCFR